MTRINVVEPIELSDNFLKAEIFELPRLWDCIIKAADRGEDPYSPKNPLVYVLGQGHMRFFYNKLTFINARWALLCAEAQLRRIDINIDPMVAQQEPIPYPLREQYKLGSVGWWQDYIPTPDAIQANRNRLAIRRNYTGGMYG